MNRPQIILDNIHSPRDLDQLNAEQIKLLAQEIREFLIESISKTGGHLASNLGVVELTLAIHRVFHSPCDKIVWDVGHQAYTHKILTGRKDLFDTLRKENGISGFPKPSESPHDAFRAGHSSNSVSAGYGIAKALSLKGSKSHVVAVLGDGSFTGGMVYEAFNNAGRSKDNLVVILNHNEMSISKNVGALAKYLSSFRTKASYHSFKKTVEKTLDRVPLVGTTIKRMLTSSKNLLKKWIYNTTYFEEMGFEYLGPIDGHDYETLVSVLDTAKSFNRPVVVHVDTVKGKGYSYAEENPGAYHGISKFDVETGNPDVALSDSFSTEFGQYLADLADEDNKICAITAAMKYGTGLQYFSSRHRDRFFDVGIAEQHAVTFAAGLASQGFLPVFAVYSSFLQRSYDQIIHDCAIDGQHVVLCIDRAGIVGDDGETHQGLFDICYLTSIPNVTIYSPESYAELRCAMHRAMYETPGVAAVRYPRGSERVTHKLVCTNGQDFLLDDRGGDTLLVTFGRLTEQACQAAEALRARGKEVSVLKLMKLCPLPQDALAQAARFTQIFFFEEGMKAGGLGQQFLSELVENGYRGAIHITAIGPGFVQQATTDSALHKYRLDAAGMERTIMARSEEPTA